MYKVFCGEKRILLTDKSIQSENRIIKYISCKKLFADYTDFYRGKEECIQFVSNNLNNLWNNFLSMFTVIEAAGGFVKDEKEKLLMIYRNSHWDLPKGKIEKGEKIEDAAMREVKEECGISDLKIIRHLNETYHIYQLHRTNTIKKTFWFEMYCENCELTPQTTEGITEAKWMNKKDVQHILPLVYPSIREIVLENYK
ncbi:MAG: NUDIX domain-containing protein [Bacteroidota bacterium]